MTTGPGASNCGFRSGGPRAAGRRLAWRLHLGRAGPAARGALAADRRHLRHLGRRDERRRAGRRLCRGWRRRRARGARALLAPRLGSGALQPVPARPARRAARPLDARPFARLRRHGPDVAPVLALRPEPERRQSAAATSWPKSSISSGWRARRSSCSSPPPTSAPAAAASSATPRSRPTCCSPRPACRPCSRRSRSTASPIGTAAIPAIPTITPLVRECDSQDTILVQINPVERPGTPRTAPRDPQPAQRGLVQRACCSRSCA